VYNSHVEVFTHRMEPASLTEKRVVNVCCTSKQRFTPYFPPALSTMTKHRLSQKPSVSYTSVKGKFNTVGYRRSFTDHLRCLCKLCKEFRVT